jgi:hypothetical protein
VAELSLALVGCGTQTTKSCSVSTYTSSAICTEKHTSDIGEWVKHNWQIPGAVVGLAVWVWSNQEEKKKKGETDKHVPPKS